MTNCPHCGNPVGPTDKNCPSCKRGLTGKDVLASAVAVSHGAKPYVTMPAGAILLMLAAVGAGLLGIVLSSQASAGASLVGFACLLGILARINQAAAYERKR